MGKPSKAAAPGETGDAVPLHPPAAGRSLPGYAYADRPDQDDAPELEGLDGFDDLPPVYSNAADTASSAPLLPPPLPDFIPAASPRYRPFRTDTATGDVAYVDQALVSSPEALERLVRELAAAPPRPHIHVTGSHRETRRSSDGRSETATVVDFDVAVELTPYLYSDARRRRSWARLRTAADADAVHRGTRLARRAPGGAPPPSLEEWCHRFCASHAGLKCFTLRRRVSGFDAARVGERLRALVRATNYRGDLDVRLLTRDARVDVYNDAVPNRGRLTGWVRLLFFCTLLFVLAWPYLWLRTRRWDVAVADWPFSRVADDDGEDEGGEGGEGGHGGGTDRRRRRYVALSEDDWYNMWARAIRRAVLDRRQKTLDQEDLRAAAADAEPSFESTGPGAIGLFRAGLNAMNEVNVQLGWGGDR